MAQISKGTRVGYMVQGTSPKSYTFVPELTGIPALGATPSTHQVTTLSDSMHKYIKGLIDVGGSLEFPCIFTDDIISAIETAISSQESDVLEWCVEFPSPLGRRAYFTGEASTVYNESVDVDAPVTGNLSLVPTSPILWESASYTVTYDSNGGSVVASATPLYGALVPEPAEPTFAGNTFVGWFYDALMSEPVDFTSDRVVGDITLYADWS